MLRLPAHLVLGPFTIHLDVLAARVQRQRRRIRHAVLTASLLLSLSVMVWLLIPLVRGSGTLLVPPLPAAVQIYLAETPLTPGAIMLPSGTHTLRIEQPGAFAVTSVVEVRRNLTTTLALPVLRPIPLVQALPLPHPQSSWLQVSPDASHGWRLTATRPAPEPTGPRPGWGQTQPSPAPYQLHLDPQGLSRLAVLESYPIADEIVDADGRRFWAVWEPQTTPQPAGSVGQLTVTTPAGTQVLSTTVRLRGLWWSPGGHMLLVALPRDHGVDLIVVPADQPQLDGLASLMTVPGAVQSLAWSPDGRAVVVITDLEAASLPTAAAAPRATPTTLTPAEHGAWERTAVLIRLPQPGRAAHATRLRVPPSRPAGLVPLAWSPGTLWWVADTGLGLALDRMSLADGQTERVGALPDDLAALTVLPDTTLRIVRTQPDGHLVIQRWPEAQTLVVLPSIQAQGWAGGIWLGEELLLATGPTALWYVQIAPEALQ